MHRTNPPQNRRENNKKEKTKNCFKTNPKESQKIQKDQRRKRQRGKVYVTKRKQENFWG